MSHLQDQILEFLRASPGGHTMREISDGTGVNKHTLEHSIHGLAGFGLIEARREGRKWCWYVRE